MTKREELKAMADSNVARIKALKLENIEIAKQLFLLSDDEQQFWEKMETVSERKNGKKVKVDRLIGRIHWKEDFKDDGTGEIVTINRSQVVRVDGEWDW